MWKYVVGCKRVIQENISRPKMHIMGPLLLQNQKVCWLLLVSLSRLFHYINHTNIPYYMKLLLQKIFVHQIVWPLNFGRLNDWEIKIKNTNLNSTIDWYDTFYWYQHGTVIKDKVLDSISKSYTSPLTQGGLEIICKVMIYY